MSCSRQQSQAKWGPNANPNLTAEPGSPSTCVRSLLSPRMVTMQRNAVSPQGLSSALAWWFQTPSGEPSCVAEAGKTESASQAPLLLGPRANRVSCANQLV